MCPSEKDRNFILSSTIKLLTFAISLIMCRFNFSTWDDYATSGRRCWIKQKCVVWAIHFRCHPSLRPVFSCGKLKRYLLVTIAAARLAGWDGNFLCIPIRCRSYGSVKCYISFPITYSRQSCTLYVHALIATHNYANWLAHQTLPVPGKSSQQLQFL